MAENVLLSEEEILISKRKNEEYNQLAFGIMVAYFKIHIKIPTAKETPISAELRIQVANVLDIKEIEFVKFNWKGRTAERYRDEIRELFCFRESVDEDAPEFLDYLIVIVLPHNPSDEALQEHVRQYFFRHKIEIFADEQLERYISSAIHKFEQRLFQEVFESLSDENLLQIDQILVEHISNTDSEIIELSELKKGIPGARPKNVQYAIEKINQLAKITMPLNVEERVNRKVLLKYYNRIMALHPSNIIESSPLTKYASMAIFCHIRLQIMLDSLCEVLIKLIRHMHSNAESYVDKHILKEIKRVDGKFDILEKLARANYYYPKGIIENKVYPNPTHIVPLVFE